MMASVQERMQISRTPLDKWSTREQLCLASTVSSDQNNWMAVSRTLKIVCGNESSADNRPADWFSQKSCALQYSHLLENAIEIPKTKSCTNESGSPVPSATSADMILRRLTEERTQELKADIRREQEEYAKIYGELKSMQAGQLTEEQLLEMWRDLEKQQEMQRIEEMKLENQMRERDQRTQEMQRNWRSGTQKSATDTTAVDMDVEEIVGATSKPVAQQQQQSGPSPLLSSLLKTSTVATTTNTVITSSARSSAPTITTLLTSGSIPNPNQPVLTLKNCSPPGAVQMLTRPISGPPVDSLSAPTNVTQNLLSPSQSSPTLSMLLEKNNFVPAAAQSNRIEVAANAVAPANTEQISSSADFNAEEVPMDIEEDVAIAVAAAASSNMDLNANIEADFDDDDPDPNEEQQLLEVFKNIGNIDELDIDVSAVIDEEVDFLKDVDQDEESPPNDGQTDFETKLESATTTSAQASVSTILANNDTTKNSIKIVQSSNKCQETNANEAFKDDATTLAIEKLENSSTTNSKIESSDDSNDNIPLAAVASLEHKERSYSTPITTTDNQATSEKSFLKEKVESAIKNEEGAEACANEEQATIVATALEMPDVEEHSNLAAVIVATVASAEIPASIETKSQNVQQNSPTTSDNSDVIVIPTDDDDESNSVEKTTPSNAKPSITSVQQEEDINKIEEAVVTLDGKPMIESEEPLVNDGTIELQETIKLNEPTLPPPVISIADTDEDSSTTDASITTRKDDKILSISKIPQRKQDTNTRNEQNQKLDDDFDALTSTNILARPPVLRKLRDRDRSESPMIEDDTTTTSEHSINQRSRRRYSSTPVIDSIPNSPASSDRDDREAKSSKKSLLSILNALQPNKNAAVFQRALTDDEEYSSKYDEICLRPMDLQMIKRNIESGSIRSVYELQRDLMLMCQNALMIFKVNSTHYKAVLAFMQECQTIREFLTSTNTQNEVATKTERETRESRSSTTSLNTSGVRVRGSSRKSQRIT